MLLAVDPATDELVARGFAPWSEIFPETIVEVHGLAHRSVDRAGWQE
jgi:hypothetical protein